VGQQTDQPHGQQDNRRRLGHALEMEAIDRGIVHHEPQHDRLARQTIQGVVAVPAGERIEEVARGEGQRVGCRVAGQRLQCRRIEHFHAQRAVDHRVDDQVARIVGQRDGRSSPRAGAAGSRLDAHKPICAELRQAHLVGNGSRGIVLLRRI